MGFHVQRTVSRRKPGKLFIMRLMYVFCCVHRVYFFTPLLLNKENYYEASLYADL